MHLFLLYSRVMQFSLAEVIDTSIYTLLSPLANTQFPPMTQSIVEVSTTQPYHHESTVILIDHHHLRKIETRYQTH